MLLPILRGSRSIKKKGAINLTIEILVILAAAMLVLLVAISLALLALKFNLYPG